MIHLLFQGKDIIKDDQAFGARLDAVEEEVYTIV